MTSGNSGSSDDVLITSSAAPPSTSASAAVIGEAPIERTSPIEPPTAADEADEIDQTDEIDEIDETAPAAGFVTGGGFARVPPCSGGYAPGLGVAPMAFCSRAVASSSSAGVRARCERGCERGTRRRGEHAEARREGAFRRVLRWHSSQNGTRPRKAIEVPLTSMQSRAHSRACKAAHPDRLERPPSAAQSPRRQGNR